MMVALLAGIALYGALVALPAPIAWGATLGGAAGLVTFARDIATRPETPVREAFAVVLASFLAAAVLAATVVRGLRTMWPGRVSGRADAARTTLVPLVAFGGTFLLLSAVRS